MSALSKLFIVFTTLGVITTFLCIITTSSYFHNFEPLSSSTTTTTTTTMDAVRNVALVAKANNSAYAANKAIPRDEVILRDIFGQWKARKEIDVNSYTNIPKTQQNRASVNYAVIAASTPTNLRDPNAYNYVFDLPLTVIAWQRIGFKSIVFLTGSTETWKTSPVLSLIQSYLQDLEARVVFLDTPPEHAVMLSQTARLFACCLDGIYAEDYLVTSDSDLWPINRDKFVLRPGVALLSTNAYESGTFRHKTEEYVMLALSSIGAFAKTWEDVMFGGNKDYNNREYGTKSDDNNKNINNNNNNNNNSSSKSNIHCLQAVTPSTILDYFRNEFGDMVYNEIIPGDNDGWFLDQHMISLRVQQWRTRVPNNRNKEADKHKVDDNVNESERGRDTNASESSENKQNNNDNDKNAPNNNELKDNSQDNANKESNDTNNRNNGHNYNQTTTNPATSTTTTTTTTTTTKEPSVYIPTTPVVEFARRLPGDRLDRNGWRFRGLGALTDSHLLTNMYRTDTWGQIHHLLIALYGEASTYFSLCQRYREDFVAELQLALHVYV